jgi:hypothetical protein
VAASVCAHIDNDKIDGVEPIDSYAWSLLGEKKPLLVERKVEHFSNHVHYHLDVEINGKKGEGGDKLAPSEILAIPPFLQTDDCLVTYWATYAIDRLSLKPDNFVRVLTGLALERSGYDLEFQSCSLNVFGDSALRELRWHRVNESEIRVSIASVGSHCLGDQSLKDGVEVIAEAVKALLPTAKPKAKLRKAKAAKSAKSPKKKRGGDG